MGGGADRAPRQEERRRHDVELEALLAQLRQGPGNVGRLHVAELHHDLGEVRPDRLHPDAVRLARARRVHRLHREDDVLLVQHLVVLQVVQECGRRDLGVAREKDRGAAHVMRRALLQHGDELEERHVGLAGLVGQDRDAAHPGPHHHDEDARQHEGHVAAVEHLEQVREQEQELDHDEGHDRGDRRDRRPFPGLPQHDVGHARGEQHRAGHRDAVGRGQCRGGAEQHGEHHDADQQQEVDLRQEDLARMRFRGVADLEAGQEAELDRLARERERAGDHRLTRGDGGERRQDHHRDQAPFGDELVERIGGVGLGEHQRGLAEIVQGQARRDEPEPGHLDRAAPEMPKIGEQRLRPRHRQEHGAERDQRPRPVAEQVMQGVPGVEGREHARIVVDVRQGGQAKRQEPDHHDRPEEGRDLARPPALDEEQRHDDRDRDRQHVMLEGRRDELDALHRRQHRDRRGDDGVAVEQGRTEQPQHEHDARAAERLAGQRHEGEDAALAAVVHAQQEDDVLHGHDDQERPEDQRGGAEHLLGEQDAVGARRRQGLAEGVERARADVAVDHADRAYDEGPEGRRHGVVPRLRRFGAEATGRIGRSGRCARGDGLRHGMRSRLRPARDWNDAGSGPARRAPNRPRLRRTVGAIMQ